jgi:hypothetical protein
MRRILLVLKAGAMMAVMLVAGTIPAVGAPGDKSANVTPNTCFEQAGGTTCFHTVVTPDDTLNSQLRSRNILDPADDGANVRRTNEPALLTNTDIITPSGNGIQNTHATAPEQ